MANRRFLLRVLGYLVAGALLGLGIGTGGTVGAVLLTLGLVVVAALLFTFRAR